MKQATVLSLFIVLTSLQFHSFGQSFPVDCKGTVSLLPGDNLCENVPIPLEGTLPPEYADSAVLRVDGVVQTYLQTTPYKIASDYVFTTPGAHLITLFVRDTFGCIDTDTLRVNVMANTAPVITRAGDTLSINVSNADSIKWKLNDLAIAGADTSFIITDSTGYYTATIYYHNGCSVTTDVFTLNDNPCFLTSIISAIPFGLVPDTICQNTSLTLSANTVATFDSIVWKINGVAAANDSLDMAGFPFVQRVYVADSGFTTISLLVRDTNGCIMEDSVIVFARKNELPLFNHTGDTLQVLNIAPMYQWIVNDSLNQGITGPKVATPRSGVYIASAFSEDSFTVNTCVATADIYINLHPGCRNISLSAGDTSFCQNEDITLQAVIPSEYLVNTQLSLDGNALLLSAYDSTNNLLTQQFDSLSAGVHTVRLSVSDNASCQFTDTIYFSIRAVDTPVISILSDTFPNRDTLAVAVNNASSLQWLHNGISIAGADSSIYIANTTGFFSVRAAFSGGCSVLSQAVALNPDSCMAQLFGINDLPTDTLCQQDCLALGVFPGDFPDSIRWYLDTVLLSEKKITAMQDLSEPVCFRQSGNVSVIVWLKHATGCIATDTLKVFVKNNPPAMFIHLDEVVAATLSADTFSWYSDFVLTKSSPDSILHICAPAYVGLETVQSNGCRSSVSQYADFGEGCTIGALIAPDTACQNTSVVLKAYLPENVYRYTWFFGDGDSLSDTLASKSQFLLAEHTYPTPGLKTVRLRVENCAGCVSEDSITIFIDDNPLVNIIQSGDTLAVASTLADSTYEWLLNGVPLLLSDTPKILMPSSGYYLFEVTRTNGCKTSDENYFYNAPCDFVDAHFTASGTTFCQSDTVSLQATSTEDILYDWRLNNVSFSTSKTASAALNTIGINTLTLITSENTQTCADTFSRTFIVNTLPAANAGNDFGICIAGKGNLNASGGTSYLWSPPTFLSNPNIANPQITLDSSVAFGTVLTYSVRVTNLNNCVAFDSVKITVGNATFAGISNDTTICFGETAQLMATGGVSYQWFPENSLNDASISNPIASPVDTTGYRAIVIDANNCADTVYMTVNVYEQVPANAGPDVSICLGGSTQLAASGGVSYVWSPNSGLSSNTVPNPFAFPSATTTYSVMVTDGNGCTAVDFVTVSIGGVLIPNAGPDIETCEGTSVQLLAFGGTTYTWNPSAGLSNPNISNPVFSGNSTTQYIITVSDGVCTGNDTLLITVNPLPPRPLITRNGNVLSTFPGYVYQWFFNGSPIPGATDISYTAMQNGNYKVRITDANGCLNTSDELNFVTGIEEKFTEIINIYPNPSDGMIYIDCRGRKSEAIEVFNVLGTK
ncbi:MAG TPA: PKD domain-containing protein, partial [Chitinophagales bacterium]|nr:PKD domain-containing protein [Chitinophagales bacterium]